MKKTTRYHRAKSSLGTGETAQNARPFVSLHGIQSPFTRHPTHQAISLPISCCLHCNGAQWGSLEQEHQGSPAGCPPGEPQKHGVRSPHLKWSRAGYSPATPPNFNQGTQRELNTCSWMALEMKGFRAILPFPSAGLNHCFHQCCLAELIYRYIHLHAARQQLQI